MMRKKLLAISLLLSLAGICLSLVAPSGLGTRFSVAANAATPAPVPGQKKVVLNHLGMSCAFCKAAVSAKLKQLPGVVAFEVDLRSDSATVVYQPEKVTLEEIKQAVAEAGFQVRAVEEVGK